MSVLTTQPGGARGASISMAPLSSRRTFWLVLVLYLVIHVALRLWITQNIGKNDVQEALAAQGWAWGYHPRNPPLHTWLLMATYSVIGVGVFAHVVLKYLLLGAAYTFAYLCGRRLFSIPALAFMAALSVSLLTPFAWTVHTALTHTLLLAVVIFATLWAAVRLVHYQRLVDYAVLGLMIGLGLLAKYSYPLFLIPLIAAMLCQAEFRRVLLHPAFLLTLAVAALVFAPHGVWMATARFDFLEFLAEKQRAQEPHPYYVDLLKGAGAVTMGALSFLGPLLLIAAAFLRPDARTEPAPRSPWARTLLLALCFGLGLLLLDVVVLRATQFEERYFVCALLLAPFALFMLLDRRRVPDRALVRFGAGALIASLVVVGGLLGRAIFYNRTCDRCLDEAPVSALASDARSRSGFQQGMVIADHYDLAGNMRIAFPSARVMAANYIMERPVGNANGQCMIVWNARRAGDGAPASLREYLLRRGLALPSGGPIFVDAPLLRSSRMDRLAYWVLPNADGNCSPR